MQHGAIRDSTPRLLGLLHAADSAVFAQAAEQSFAPHRMDFDSSLFDMPFEDLASLTFDTQPSQQQQAFAVSGSPLMDFQEFCCDFAGNDFGDTMAPAWSFELPSVSPTHSIAVSPKAPKVEDAFLDGFDKTASDPLAPYDSSLQGMFSYSSGNDAQVVPDMAPGDANAPEFSLPTFSQSYVAPKSTSNGPVVSSRPFSWMNGIDYASFGWPARTRLPSKACYFVAECYRLHHVFCVASCFVLGFQLIWFSRCTCTVICCAVLYKPVCANHSGVSFGRIYGVFSQLVFVF